MLYLLTYDIADPKRLARLYRALKKRAVPIQYSVFLARLGSSALKDMQALVLSIIDERKDDVRFYPLPRYGWSRRLGRGTLPSGILLTMLPDEFSGTTWETPGPADAPTATALDAPKRGRQERALRRRVQTGQRNGIQLI